MLSAADTKGQGWEQLCPCWASFGGFLSLNSCTQSHGLILTKVTQKECFSFTKTLCSYTCFHVISHVQQIHLLQFHGTRYAAIDPSMVSAEELEVQKISLHTSNEQEGQ